MCAYVIPVPFYFLLLLFCFPLLADGPEAGLPGPGWGWLHLQEQSIWLPKPAGWNERQQTDRGLFTLEMEAPDGRSGVMLWGGDLGARMDWRQLANIWRNNSADLTNLEQLQEYGSPDAANTGIEGVDIHFQEYAGQVAGEATRTWVGYLPHGDSSYVLMGIFPQSEPDAGANVRRIITGLRLIPPEPLVPQPPSDQPDEQEPPEQEQIAIESPPEPLQNLRLFGGDSLITGPVSRDIQLLSCRAEVTGLEGGELVRADWYYLDGAGTAPFVSDEQRYPAAAEEMTFLLRRPDNALFPAGSYRLLLQVGEAVASIDFLLRDPSVTELLEQARQGRAEGQFGLYAYLEAGQLDGVTEPEALEWLQKAAQQGMAIAQHHLGRVYFEGRHGVAEDAMAAMDWFRRAALQGHAESAYYLAKGYREGSGLQRSLLEAVAWTRRAANLGDHASQYNLALHYLSGQGVEESRQLAVTWLRKAADAGYRPARDALIYLERHRSN